MATEISAPISWSHVLHPDIGARGKWNFPQDGTAGGRFVDDGDRTGATQRHSLARYLADGALRVNYYLYFYQNVVHSILNVFSSVWSSLRPAIP